MILCPICKNDSRLIWKEGKYTVFKCSSCKLAFLYPVPSEIEKIYDKEYFEKWYLRFYDERKIYFENLVEKLKKYLPSSGKLLDVGCGAGIFLDVMKKNGWDVYGQDTSPFAVEYCRKNGYKVFNSSLDKIDLPDNNFDVITILDVIAHIKNPLSYLKTCRRALKPDGILIIKTPNHTDFLFYIARFFSFTGKSRSLLHIPAQIYHFNIFSLEKLLQKENLSRKKIFLTLDFSSGFKGTESIIRFILREKSILSVSVKNG